MIVCMMDFIDCVCDGHVTVLTVYGGDVTQISVFMMEMYLFLSVCVCVRWRCYY